MVSLAINSGLALFDNPGETVVKETPFYTIYKNAMGEKTLSMDWSPVSSVALIPNVTGFRGIEYDYTGHDNVMQFYLDANISNPNAAVLYINNSELTYHPLSMSWNHGNGTVDLLANSNGGSNESTSTVVRYNDTFGPGVHLEYQYNPYAVKETIIVPNETALSFGSYNMTNRSLEIAFAMDRMSNLTLFVDGVAWNRTSRVMTDRDILIADENNNTFAHINRPTVDGANGAFQWGSLILQNRSDKFDIIISIEAKAFNQNLQYPLSIDPNLQLSGAPATLNGNYTFENVEILNGATLYAGGPENGTLRLIATNSIYVDSTSTIDGSGRGSPGGAGASPTNNGNPGSQIYANGGTPGGGGSYNGATTWGEGGAGGGHGGVGGYGAGGATGGTPTGSQTDNTAPAGSGAGSGGGSGSQNSPAAGGGGSGIYLEANNMTIKGTIITAGYDGGSTYSGDCFSGSNAAGSGGGPGGAIVLNASIADTSGSTLDVDGGGGGRGRREAANAGGGGGGRIKIFFGNWLTNASMSISKAGGGGGSICGNTAGGNGGEGTYYAEETGEWSFDHVPVIVDANITSLNVTAGQQHALYAITNDTDASTFIWANFSLLAPNGTVVLNNVNGSYFNVLATGLTQEEPSSWNWTSNNFTIPKVSSSLGNWTWNVTTVDNTTKESTAYTGLFGIIDRNTPNIANLPSGNKTSLTIDLQVSVSDDIEISKGRSCRYNVTRGASVEIANTWVTCNNNTEFTVSSDTTTYAIGYLVNDTSNKLKHASSTFYVDVSQAPSTPPVTGGGGGGGSTIQEITQVFSSTLLGATSIDRPFIYTSFTNEVQTGDIFVSSERTVTACNVQSDYAITCTPSEDLAGVDLTLSYQSFGDTLSDELNAQVEVVDDTNTKKTIPVTIRTFNFAWYFGSDPDPNAQVTEGTILFNQDGKTKGVRAWPIALSALVLTSVFILRRRKKSATLGRVFG